MLAELLFTKACYLLLKIKLPLQLFIVLHLKFDLIRKGVEFEVCRGVVPNIVSFAAHVNKAFKSADFILRSFYFDVRRLELFF